MTALLQTSGLVKRFGGVTAVGGVDLRADAHEALAVIGPNGAGKSTLLALLAGLHRPDEGEIRLAGVAHGRARADQIARRGVALARQVPAPFKQLTVRENVSIGALHRTDEASHDLVSTVLGRCGLAERAERPAGSLALLDLKRLELARALSLEPRLLLLDEVAAGLVGAELEAIIALVASIRDDGVALVIVEHVERVVRELVERVVVLDWGKVIAEGTPAQIARDGRVREIYLGTGGKAPRGSRAPAPAARSTATSAELVVEGLSAGYGNITALRGVDLHVGAGETVAVLGANGAGKTTLTRAISGLNAAWTGSIRLDGVDVTTMPAHQRARLGIAHCQEGRRLFAGLSVQENLLLGARSPEARAAFDERRRWVCELFPILEERADQPAQTLSGGQQQMLAIGRAVTAQPRLIIFDEISLGLAPAAIDVLYRAIEQIRDAGISIVLVEQNVQRSLSLAERAYVLERGSVSFAGDPSELLDDARLEAAYFGTGTASSVGTAAVPVATATQEDRS